LYMRRYVIWSHYWIGDLRRCDGWSRSNTCKVNIKVRLSTSVRNCLESPDGLYDGRTILDATTRKKRQCACLNYLTSRDWFITRLCFRVGIYAYSRLLKYSRKYGSHSVSCCCFIHL